MKRLHLHHQLQQEEQLAEILVLVAVLVVQMDKDLALLLQPLIKVVEQLQKQKRR